MHWQGKTLGACVAVSAMLLAESAFAQEDAAAEALFNKGLSEMEAGHFEVACPTLKESQRLDPRMGTLFTLAECEAKGGMIASAVAHYDEYLRLFARLAPPQKALQSGREKVSAAQKAALSPQVPYVTLVLRDAPAGTTVKWDDMLFNLPALGVPLPVNPGEHVVTTQAPGAVSVVTRVSVDKAERKEIELKIGPQHSAKASPAAPLAPLAPPPAALPTGAPRSEEADAGGSSASRKIWISGAGGLGAMGLVVGSITGALVLGKKGTIEDNCEGTRCNAAGKEAADSAKSLGLVSTIGFGVGIAGLATAAVLFLTEPKSAAAARSWAPLVADRGGGVVVGLQRTW
jgi:hypothetical protein